MKKVIKETEKKIDPYIYFVKYTIPNKYYHNFNYYIREIFKDLNERSEDKSKGINRIALLNYFKLNGIINERIFDVIDVCKNSYISKKEFCSGMNTLYSSNYLSLLNFTFKLYDFNDDKLITRDDIRIVLSYLPLKPKPNSSYFSKYELDTLEDQLKSQDEIEKILNKMFQSEERLDFNLFKHCIENVTSEAFVYLITYILENKPFDMRSIIAYKYNNKKLEEKESNDNKNSLIIIANNETNFNLKIQGKLKENDIITMENYLYKKDNNNNLKLVYYKLIEKDLYCKHNNYNY